MKNKNILYGSIASVAIVLCVVSAFSYLPIWNGEDLSTIGKQQMDNITTDSSTTIGNEEIGHLSSEAEKAEETEKYVLFTSGNTRIIFTNTQKLAFGASDHNYEEVVKGVSLPVDAENFVNTCYSNGFLIEKATINNVNGLLLSQKDGEDPLGDIIGGGEKTIYFLTEKGKLVGVNADEQTAINILKTYKE